MLCLTGLSVVCCEIWMMGSCCILALLLHANVVNYNENKFQWAFFSVTLSMGISSVFIANPNRTSELQDYCIRPIQWVLNRLSIKRIK